ncbi:MAG: hypothetical protein QXM31_01290, partial [Candidatus Woesearchaeota archaeon]
MKKPETDLLFVELREPSATRRDVLMSTKDVLDVLRRYEEYRRTSDEKQKALAELKQVVDSLQSLNRRLRNKMPKVPFKAESHELAREGEDESIMGPAPETARPKSKLDILQEELEKIE